MTVKINVPLSREQIEAIQARAEKAHTHWYKITEFLSFARTDIPAICQQALRAIELEADLTSWQEMHAAAQACSMERYEEIQRLQSELTAARKALEQERERCAKEVVFCGECDCPLLSQKAIRALQSPQVKG